MRDPTKPFRLEGRCTVSMKRRASRGRESSLGNRKLILGGVVFESEKAEGLVPSSGNVSDVLGRQ